MKNYDYGYGFKPISSWGYVGYSLLWSIPVIGWIFWLCAAIGAKNRNVRNYARSYICAVLIMLAISAVAVAVAVILDACDVVTFEEVMDYLKKYINQVEAKLD